LTSIGKLERRECSSGPLGDATRDGEQAKSVAPPQTDILLLQIMPNQSYLLVNGTIPRASASRGISVQ